MWDSEATRNEEGIKTPAPRFTLYSESHSILCRLERTACQESQTSCALVRSQAPVMHQHAAEDAQGYQGACSTPSTFQ